MFSCFSTHLQVPFSELSLDVCSLFFLLSCCTRVQKLRICLYLTAQFLRTSLTCLKVSWMTCWRTSSTMCSPMFRHAVNPTARTSESLFVDGLLNSSMLIWSDVHACVLIPDQFQTSENGTGGGGCRGGELLFYFLIYAFFVNVLSQSILLGVQVFWFISPFIPQKMGFCIVVFQYLCVSIF